MLIASAGMKAVKYRLYNDRGGGIYLLRANKLLTLSCITDVYTLGFILNLNTYQYGRITSEYDHVNIISYTPMLVNS